MAPSARAVHKAEAKYGVTADYPDLQLHAAAANGNVGLVKYALMHGQPVNSVLNGVLPIHIAASSGNDLVVQMLIDAGADVNAARLPRKYNADRSKAISSIGAAGSTPLHFAAANGHAHIVSLLLSHGANPDATEKHGLTPEDLAREAGHVNVVTVFRLWKQDQHATDNHSEAGGYNQYLGNELYSSPPSASGSGYSGGKLASSAASIHSVASTTGRKLLSKPSLDSISNKGKRLAKAASNPNLAGLLPLSSSSHPSNNAGPSSSHSPPYALASSFAQPQVALRQNPSKALAKYIQNHPNAPLIHHVVNLDKSRRPSLPSVFEKAAHPSQSIKSALGLNSHSNSSRLGSRGTSASSQDHDPYHLARPRRSSSKTSLTGLFKSHQHNKEKSAESYNSQPLSPAASTFFTGDDELEQAERDMFLRADQYSDNENGQPQYPFSGLPLPPSRPGTGNQDSRRTSIDGFTSMRSRAGSASSAATSHSNISHANRGQDSRSLFNYPMTAPPTQTTFTNLENEPGQTGYLARPALHAHSSAGSVVIPQPIPAPPSSSTQPFFSKAAISAAHNNNTARPGFYRPRKSSQLSTATSTMTNANYTVSSPDPENRSLSHQSRSAGGSSDAETSNESHYENNTLVPPALIVRRPTVRDGSTSQGAEDGYNRGMPTMSSPRQSANESPGAVSPPSSAPGRSAQLFSSNGNRHARTISDGTGSIRQATSLPDVQESPEAQLRLSSNDHFSPSRSDSQGPSEVDHNGRRESEDVFPPNAEAPFSTRSRAGSRARVDSAGSSTGPIPHLNLTGTSSPQYPSPAVLSSFQQHHTAGDTDGHWKAVTRAQRSDSTTTDTRTSRSGSVGESGGQHHRFFGFDYSSSPTGSQASFKYHPSASTTATSLISSPPGTAVSVGQGTSVTHAQAQHMVKKKEEELLSYDPSETSQGSSARRPSLSQQLAAYGDSLAIERELHDAERYRQNPHERIALTIPEPPASAKYSWEILGKETRTTMPVSKGQRAREKHDPPSSVVQQQKLWTHRMVSPYEVPLNRPGTHVGGHRHTPSTSTITSSGKPLMRVVSNETTSPSQDRLPSIPQSPAISAVSHPAEPGLRNKPSSNLSLSRGYLAPPQQSGGSDLSIKKSPRVRSISPGYISPRSSGERERERVPPVYHVVAGPGSEPTDSANSSLVSEPRSSVRHHGHGGSSTITIGSRHRYNRSDPPSTSPSPDASHVLDEQTPRPPQLLRLETVMAPKFHIEQKAGGEAAPSPTKVKFGSKLGKLFR